MLHAPLRCSGPLAVWDGIDREGEGRLCWRPSISLRNRFRRKSTRARRDALTERLVVLQQEARAAGVGLVVLFEGWNGAGKGSRISDLMYNLDARATSVYVTENFNAVDAASFPGAEHGVGGFYPMMQQFWKALGRAAAPSRSTTAAGTPRPCSACSTPSLAR